MTKIKSITPLLLLFAVFTPISNCFSQANNDSFKLELTNANFGINIGPYRGRTPQTNGPFNQGFSGFGQVYFPLKLSYKNSKASIDNEYANKLILIRPSMLIHIIDNGSYAYGSGIQLSVRSFKQFYLEYQFGIVYLEARKDSSPDLHDGMNLHNFLSISKPLNQHFTASIGFIHLSKGFFDSTTSNQDVISLGLKWNL
ncbi:MAG: hypothetical protein ACPGSL_03265 [Vicingaceae bacterium]